MKNSHFHRIAALLLAAALALGLCACSMPKEYVEPPKTEAPAPAEAAAQTPAAPAAEPAAEPTQTPTTEPAAPAEEPELAAEAAEGPAPEEAAEEPAPDEQTDPLAYETLVDEDGDGIINYRFFYKGASVYALIVLDPSRVFVGTAQADPASYGRGLTLDEMAEKYGAVAGINAGGFKDEDGGGDGWPPSGVTLSRGQVFGGEELGPIAGFDQNDHMWVGYLNVDDCLYFGIRDTVSFGPSLVMSGEKVDPAELENGIGARTLIGQREDGAIVLVAIDGRQGYSIGVTFADCVEIMADKFGCVNAANMDGGNSTCMYYNGEAVNRSANKAAGTRNLPDAWLVSPLPEDYVRPEGVLDSISIPKNALGEVKQYVAECDEETKEKMYTFAWVFTKAYYGYFGTPYYERHYSDLLQHVAQDCELRRRAELALMDRKWVNTWNTEPTAITVDGAYVNEDGSYDILITVDAIERSGYWTYEPKGLKLRITVVDAPKLPYGFLATDVY